MNQEILQRGHVRVLATNAHRRTAFAFCRLFALITEHLNSSFIEINEKAAFSQLVSLH
jgi:hypothetical protein